jgi:hypothetical protein
VAGLYPSSVLFPLKQSYLTIHISRSKYNRVWCPLKDLTAPIFGLMQHAHTLNAHGSDNNNLLITSRPSSEGAMFVLSRQRPRAVDKCCHWFLEFIRSFPNLD